MSGLLGGGGGGPDPPDPPPGSATETLTHAKCTKEFNNFEFFIKTKSFRGLAWPHLKIPRVIAASDSSHDTDAIP